MTEMKMENGKNNVCRNDNNSSFLGLTRESVGDKKIPDQVGDDGLVIGSVCHKIPDQVGDDGLIVGSACSKIPAFAGMTESSRGERGRSMVEMLGVLAVMGVLSIGGVAGYRYAIDKMNANDIINEVRKRANGR